MRVLILGLGNALMNDDAFGCRVAAELVAGYEFPANVAVLDGGTLGLDLLPYLEGVDRLLIVDALEMGAVPGTIFRLEGEEVPRAFASKLSVHQMGVQDLLAVAELQGHLPGELVVWGVQVGSVEMALQLTPPVQGALAEVRQGVLDELERWGVPAEQKAA
ncbi:membrane protein [Desulfuromonas versatilis]|uniref:Membrane protein n=1 Tax=Desulfuromonas versatilis TaxID=2802975 RepID=A0ABN6E3G0_9BACT|nr:HyaD/HybD family hydrogenase maturation endopeptidase [Desulfuromonas versatilis]BCR06880.1 membrane protein [Desulfuromonas versatilis]